MDSSGGQSQEMSSDSLGSMLVAGPKAAGQAQAERKPRPQPEQALKCPRCESSNTKFCYYNNYSLTQPRYFCKACRRYWTKGGTLRNVPVGGGCRKNRRSSSSSASSPAQPKRAGLHEPNSHHQFSSGPLLHPSYAGTLMTNPGFSTLPALGPGGYDQNDLTLAFARLQKSSCAGQLGSFDHHHQQQQQLSIFGNDNIILGMSNNPTTTPGSTTAASSSGFLDALRSGFLESSYYDSNIIGGGLGDHQYGGGDDDDDEQHQDHVSSTTSTPAVTVTTIKQELCNGDINSNSMRSSSLDHHHDHNHSSGGSRMLWGFPWQMNNNGSGSDHHGIGIGIGLGTGNMVDFDDSTTAGRESWSGFASSWHGLLNSTPLM